MRRQRKYHDILEEDWARFITIGEIFFIGYLLHFLPFFFVERTLFLHHYLPAFVFKVLLTAATLDHMYDVIR
jgi:dolichyl-phosphate-mannose-protein mannosyltransferase